MKQINKYKFLNKLKGKFRVSTRLFKFKRPKWNLVKKAFLKSDFNVKFPQVYKTNIIPGWEKTKKSFKNRINLGRFLLVLNNHDRRKRSKIQNKNFIYNDDKVNTIYFKRFFELDFFLYSIYTSSSVEESKKYLESKKVFKNETNSFSKSELKKGDLIQVKNDDFEFNKIKVKFNMSENFSSFYEYDYYNQSFFILKDFSEVNKKDIYFTSTTFI